MLTLLTKSSYHSGTIQTRWNYLVNVCGQVWPVKCCSEGILHTASNGAAAGFECCVGYSIVGRRRSCTSFSMDSSSEACLTKLSFLIQVK